MAELSSRQASDIADALLDLIPSLMQQICADIPREADSGGMKRRLEVARGLLHEPQTLFLDEPTVGNPTQRLGACTATAREYGTHYLYDDTLHGRGRIL